MNLTAEERGMLDGSHGKAVRKAMEIQVALGEIYGAQRMTPVSSAQIAGVSYDNLGEAGLAFLEDMATGGGRVRVLTTLNPAGMDIENPQMLGISKDFARNQRRVIDAFTRMGVVSTCTCTPYLSGNLPHFGDHIAWAESSAVCFANSVIGARTNREGGPSALAAALTGRVAEYGFHLVNKRKPDLHVNVQALLEGTHCFGALGKAIGEVMQSGSKSSVPYLSGIEKASLEELKSFSASLATFGGAALFHIEGITPEASLYAPPDRKITLTQAELDQAALALSDPEVGEIDFVSLGCPHLTIREIARIAELLSGHQVLCEFWITTSRPIKQIADQMGYTRTIEESGAKFAVDTCCVVAPIRGRFHALATDSAKACYYANSKNRFLRRFQSFDETVLEALKPKPSRA